MCIRDRHQADLGGVALHRVGAAADRAHAVGVLAARWRRCCLLYTSDAADERSSVDLGGRRIIKKTQENPSIAMY
mgnify:CR=1 FL=1